MEIQWVEVTLSHCNILLRYLHKIGSTEKEVPFIFLKHLLYKLLEVSQLIFEHLN